MTRDEMREMLALSQCSLLQDGVCVGRRSGVCFDCGLIADKLLAAIESTGHVIVPIDPTDEMVCAGGSQFTRGGVRAGSSTAERIYDAMLTAYGQTTDRED